MVDSVGRLGELELWRDMRASKTEVGTLNFLWTIKPLQAPVVQLEERR